MSLITSYNYICSLVSFIIPLYNPYYPCIRFFLDIIDRYVLIVVSYTIINNKKRFLI